MKIHSKPELLAPAGTFDALKAAVLSGADAVYFGGTLFNARMNATNFDRTDIEKAVSFCHAHSTKAYITLNTQIYDREMQTALEYAEFLWESGADALITADLGLCSLIHRYLPDFQLHASTQMSVNNSAGANELSGRGFSRVVISRETSADDIRLVCLKSKPEIEVFVHGAMCVSCSGQCLMSAMLGGRSGNRGECAQPCRMNYNGSHPLSLKDMCLAKHIPELCEMGVASLKIEGRMKSPSYVAGVTEIYRTLIDENRPATDGEIEKLGRIFSRGGFTDGYYSGNIGKQMLGVRSENDIKNSRFERKSESCFDIITDTAPARREKIEIPRLPKPTGTVQRKAFYTARFRSANQIPDIHSFEHIYLPLHSFKNVADGVLLPPVIFDSELDSVRRELDYAVKQGAKHAMLRNVSHISLVKEFGLVPHGDFRLNVFNNFSANEVNPLESLILSVELTLPQIRDISTGNAFKGAVVYGRVPLMLLEKPVETDKLRDTKNAVFPIIREAQRDVLLNSVSIYMADQINRLDSAGVEERHMLFTTENRGEVMRVIYAYSHGTIPKEQIRRIK